MSTRTVGQVAKCRKITIRRNESRLGFSSACNDPFYVPHIIPSNKAEKAVPKPVNSISRSFDLFNISSAKYFIVILFLWLADRKLYHDITMKDMNRSGLELNLEVSDEKPYILKNPVMVKSDGINKTSSLKGNVLLNHEVLEKEEGEKLEFKEKLSKNDFFKASGKVNHHLVINDDQQFPAKPSIKVYQLPKHVKNKVQIGGMHKHYVKNNPALKSFNERARERIAKVPEISETQIKAPERISKVGGKSSRTREGNLTRTESFSSGATKEIQEVNISRAKQWALNFECLLNDEAGVATFMEFLKKEYCSENLLFWLECKKYKNLFHASTNNDDKAVMDAFMEIYLSHISLDSPFEVNIDCITKKNIEGRMLDDPATLGDIFDAAQMHVKYLFVYLIYSCPNNIYEPLDSTNYEAWQVQQIQDIWFVHESCKWWKGWKIFRIFKPQQRHGTSKWQEENIFKSLKENFRAPIKSKRWQEAVLANFQK